MIKEKDGIFHLVTKNTSYVIGVNNGVLFHLYWGKKIDDTFDFDTFLLNGEYHNLSAKDFIYNNKELSTECLPMEYPTFGSADLRIPAIHCVYDDGSNVTKLTYKKHSIIVGKPKIDGLPSIYTEEQSEVSTLIITLYDELKELEVELSYSVFEEYDSITRSVKVKNKSEKTIRLQKVLSASLDFQYNNFNVLHLPGAWVRERTPQINPLINGTVLFESRKGASSHMENPFFALLKDDASELNGEVYGLNLIYSGNFMGGIECDPYNNARVFMGINPFGFEFKLAKDETFQTPEVVMAFSNKGISGMSRIYHKLYRERLCRGKYRDIERSVLINNWEATYFDFTEEKLINIAKTASKAGIELFVLDDGWFGKRNNDKCSLGDWVVNTDKLPNGLDGLVKEINNLGMKFGIWFEPEMVSPDSDLYRNHPDWCLHTKGRSKTTCRNQLTLDLSREDVCDYIIESLTNIFKSVNIEYVKWDMNRYFSETGSAVLSSERQGEVSHRYILGLYKILETITSRFPNILFESCASGGGRYDPGMLYYMPQVWTSDDTDALERLMIQYGTSICYPYCTMGSHVSTVPNHQTGRTTPYKFRGDVAMTGQLGYELDFSKLSEAEAQLTKEQISIYKKIGADIHSAKLYRLMTPKDSNCVVNQFITDNEMKVYLFIYCLKGIPNSGNVIVRLADLEEECRYKELNSDKIYTGSILMNVGIPYNCSCDYDSDILCFEKIL